MEMIKRYEQEIELLADKVDHYTLMCAREALDALKLLAKNATGMSIGITMMYLNRMTKCKPLLPITEDDFDDNNPYDISNGKHIQCSRMSSLFKHIDVDGTVSYNDIDRVITKVDNKTTWHNGFITKLVHEMYPITFPYMPDKEFVANVKEYLFDKNNGDYDAIHFVSLKHPDGTVEQINRYFMEYKHEFVEVDAETFEKHRKFSEFLNDENV